MSTIKPIETIYKGYKFRSRLEARWAIVFDRLGLKWEYEKQGYDLGEYGLYLPDFSIQTKDGLLWFGEVKGNLVDIEAMAKVKALDNNTPDSYMGVIVFTEIDYAETEAQWLDPEKDYPFLNRNNAALTAQMLAVSEEEYNEAINQARQARFEHGEHAK